MRINCLLFLTFFACAHIDAQAVQRSPAADSALLRSLAQSELEFFAGWRNAWMARGDSMSKTSWQPGLATTFRQGRGAAINPDYVQRIRRGMAVNCGGFHAAFPNFPQSQYSRYDWAHMVTSAATINGVCPAWLEHYGALDIGHIAADSLATRMMRGELVNARRRLLSLLDSADREMPGNGWITGQRVRFRLDEGDLGGALAVTNTCGTNRWWCSTLSGLVLAKRGDVVRADSAFAAGIAATAGEARCQWTDVRALLPSKDRDAYARLSCADRDSVSANMLWLADPLFAQPGNERRVEHYVRKTEISLRSAVAFDELYNWKASAGGDAVAQMVMRYGWPTAQYWANVAADRDLDGWLADRKLAGSSPHLAPEYIREGRVHLVPAWDALRSPADATPGSWSINPDGINWWPSEHFASVKTLLEFCDDQTASLRRDPAESLLQITDDQSVSLRRQRDVLFAYATDLNRINFGQRAGDSVTAILSHSTGPDVTERLVVSRAGAVARVNVSARIPSRPAVVAFEIPNEGLNMPAVRTRFGIRPPASLAAMKPGDVAVSEPVLLDADDVGTDLPSEPTTSLARMLGSTKLRRGTKNIGVYWETYGFAPSDSVDVSVRIQRHTSQGLLRALGNAVNITSDKNTPVAMSWREPQPGRGGHVIAGTVPVVARSVVLNIATLAEGEYWLDVTVSKPGVAPVSSRRVFTVQ